MKLLTYIATTIILTTTAIANVNNQTQDVSSGNICEKKWDVAFATFSNTLNCNGLPYGAATGKEVMLANRIVYPNLQGQYEERANLICSQNGFSKSGKFIITEQFSQIHILIPLENGNWDVVDPRLFVSINAEYELEYAHREPIRSFYDGKVFLELTCIK